MVPLIQLNEGDFGEIAGISECRNKHHRRDHCGRKRGWRKRFFSIPESMGHMRMSDLGLRIGKRIQLLHKGKQGPLLVKVGDSRIAVGQKMAENILIRSDEKPASTQF